MRQLRVALEQVTWIDEKAEVFELVSWLHMLLTPFSTLLCTLQKVFLKHNFVEGICYEWDF